MFSLQEITQKFINFQGLSCDNTLSKLNLDFAIFQSIYDLPFEHWNLIVGEEKLLLSIPYLAAVESMPSQNMTYHYCIAYQHTLPVAVFFFQEFDFKLADMEANVETDKLADAKPLFDKVKSSVLSGFKNVQLRLLIAGNSYITGDYGFHLGQNFPMENFGLVMENIIQKITNTKRDGKYIQGVLIKDFSKEHTGFIKSLEQKKYFPFQVDPTMILQIPDGITTMEKYIELFSSKYRVRVRSCEKKFIGVSSRLLDMEEMKSSHSIIQQLYKNVEENAGFNLLKVPENYFLELKKNLGDAFQFRAYFLNEKMVGFSTSLLWQNMLESNFVGLDYEFNQTHGLYQNMLYDYLKQAMEANIKTIHFGRTALEIKSTIGAIPEHMTLLVKSPNSVFNRLIPRIFSNLKQSEWVQRKPFKGGEEESNT